jgi:hypothetical protein
MNPDKGVESLAKESNKRLKEANTLVTEGIRQLRKAIGDKATSATRQVSR